MPDKDTEGLVERPKGLKLYNKDNYDVLLKDLNKLVDKFVECEPIGNCYLDLDFLDRKGMLKLCYTNINNSFKKYAEDNNIILEKIDDTFEYDEHFYLTIYIHDKLNNLSDFVKYFSELKNNFNCVDYVTLSHVYNLADVDCIKLLIVLKNDISLVDELNITGFGSKYAFMADTVVGEESFVMEKEPSINKDVILDDSVFKYASSGEESSNVPGVIYTKDNYPRLLKDLNKLVDKFVECEPIEDCYLDLDFLERKGMLKLCYTNISNSFEEYAKDNNIILEKIDNTFEYEEDFYFTMHTCARVNKLRNFMKYYSELKKQFSCVDYVTLSNVYGLADADCIKLLIVLKSDVCLKDRLDIRGFGSNYAFLAEIVYGERNV